MKSLAIARVALRALGRNKGRSLLTALGIIIGIAAVIAMVAVGRGATAMVQEQMRSMGNNLVIVFPGSSRSGGFHGGLGSARTLTVADGEAIAQEVPWVQSLTPLVQTAGQVIYRDKNWATRIQGVAPTYLEVRDWRLKDGEFFTEIDIHSATRVCVLGATLVRELFAEENPLGQQVRIRNMPFRVVGVLAEKGSAAFGMDQDDVVLAPWPTVRRVLQNSTFNDVDMLMMSLSSLSVMASAEEEIAHILRQRHRLGEGADDDFTITDPTEVTSMITQVSDVMTLLLTVIASISLIVGGIGIMNIMLVSVTERTREIGLRRAVGARRVDILWQFLLEAVVLSGLGGGIGIGLGVAAASLISRFAQWPIHVSGGSLLLALAFSTGVGVFFGFYPAWRASRLNPIEALRHE